jgi:general secretion pathway protein L
MSYRLFIRPIPVEAGLFHIEWALYNMTGQQQFIGESFSIEEIEQVLQQNNIDELKIVGLIPAEYIFSTAVDIPGKQKRVILQALPYVVEEQIAEDIHHQHLALGGKLPSDLYHVNAINIEVFSSFFDLINSFGYQIEYISSDASLLGLVDVNAVACVDSDWILFKDNQGLVIRANLSNFSSFLDSVLERRKQADLNETDKELTLRFFLTDEDKNNLDISLAEIEQKENLKILYVMHHLKNTFELLCEAWYQNEDHGVNLCQGDFESKDKSENTISKWKSVAVVVSIWFILQIGIYVGQGIYYQKQADYYSAVALKTYKALFPSDRYVSARGIERRLKGRLKQVSQKSNNLGFLELLGEAGYQYSKLPDKGNFQFKSLNYSKQRGDMTIGVIVDSFDQLNNYKSNLDSAGLSTKIGSAVQEKNKVRGRLSIAGK